MREIKIVCAGKITKQYLSDGIMDALQVIRNKYPVSVIECPDEPAPDGASATEEKSIRDKEGQRILSRIAGTDYVVALCIDGERYNSMQWHKHLHILKNRIQGSLVFVIGGSLGLSDAVIKRANERLSFSAMTFPHQMMRMLLLDQIAAWSSV